MAKKGSAQQFIRGQLMLQISAGRFFRPDVPINERVHRRTIYTNCCFLDPAPVALPVGTIISSTELKGPSTIMIEAVDRLESKRPDNTDEIMIATAGDDLVDDIAYVMTFVLNRTFSRNYDQVRQLVSLNEVTGRYQGAANLFPDLFTSPRTVQAIELGGLKQFMSDLLALTRDDFIRVMRAIRNTVDATRRAFDDPTGAYTDLVAALESLADAQLTTPITWDRYDGAKRKIFDAALEGESQVTMEKVRAAALKADHAGAARRFVSSTLARVSSTYYRGEAAGKVRPPRSPDLERMLKVAYAIRSKRSHVLEDLGDEAWVFTNGAETVFEPRLQRILTLAGLWRLVRHVVHRLVADAPKTQPEPWDYRHALPGIIQAQLAPQYWVWKPEGLDAASAAYLFNGVAEVIIAGCSGDLGEGVDLTQLVEKIEELVPTMADTDAKTTMVAIYALWDEWKTPGDNRTSTAEAFLNVHGACLDKPSPTAFAVSLLSNRTHAEWTIDEWAELATARRAARVRGKEPPLPSGVDALLQLEAADQMEAAGRHQEALVFASNAVEEHPGNDALLIWEQRLIASDHDPHFNCHEFLFGKQTTSDTPAPVGQSSEA